MLLVNCLSTDEASAVDYTIKDRIKVLPELKYEDLILV